MKITSTCYLCFTLSIAAVFAAVTPKSASPSSTTTVPTSKLSDSPSYTSSSSVSSSSSSSVSQKTAKEISSLPKSTGSSSSSSSLPKENSQKVASTVKPSPSKATSSVSDEELDKLLLDRRYLSRQLKCALGEGVCDPVGRRLKSFAPLVLRGSCPQCTPSETRQIQKVLSHVQRNYPKEWTKIITQFTGNK